MGFDVGKHSNFQKRKGDSYSLAVNKDLRLSGRKGGSRRGARTSLNFLSWGYQIIILRN